MWIALLEIALVLCLLSLVWLFLGRFCQLSNDDRDDFRHEWKDLNRSLGRSNELERLMRFFSSVRRTAQQSNKVIGLHNVDQTRKVPGKS